jgi:CheY-like chemotaxis protein
MKDTKRILVVDDEARNRCLLEAIVGCMGYECQCASDGFEALACLNPEIDLVLLDIMMPGLDGFEVAQRIRSGDSCKDVPIIMVTGLNSMEDRHKASQVGANVFVTKPIDQRQLRLSISTLLNV